MTLQYAAHVDHPVSHSSDLASFGLSLVGAAIATVVVVYSGGTALLVLAEAAEAVGTVATAGSVGMSAGKLVDGFEPPSVAEGMVGSGLESVQLGPSARPAVRAMEEESKTKKCHVDLMFEGSDSVFLGEPSMPMTRRGDRTKCGGKVSDGIHSIIVGGTPSQEGHAIDEQDSFRVKALSAIWDLLGGGASFTKGVEKGALTTVARGITQAGSVVVPDDNVAKVMKATTVTFPNSTLESIDGYNTLKDGGTGASNLIKGP